MKLLAYCSKNTYELQPIEKPPKAPYRTNFCYEFAKVLGITEGANFFITLSDDPKRGYKKLEQIKPKEEFTKVSVKEWYSTFYGDSNFTTEEYYRKNDKSGWKLSGKKLPDCDEIQEILEEIYEELPEVVYLKIQEIK